MTRLAQDGTVARALLAQEALGLLTRLDQLRPFAMTETMVLAAALPFRAHRSIERFMFQRRVELRAQVRRYLAWLAGPGSAVGPAEQQRRFVAIRLRFNDVLSQLDLFSEVLTQRSEHGTGVWLSGLDRLAADALTLNVPWTDQPALVCYLARGPGAAIRRARTRLPGGQLSPIAIIRVPRERMIGHGVASSLVHEVGHQGAALLEIVEPLRDELLRRTAGRDGPAWRSWAQTVSECVADFWSVAKLGIASTLGLMAVVSLPRYFVFRPPSGDPHPMPYVRVLLSAAVGELLYPHPQWRRLVAIWKQFYPLDGIDPAIRAVVERLEATAPDMALVMAGHRVGTFGGLPLGDLLADQGRSPERLLTRYVAWRGDLAVLARRPPTLVFAAVGQARAAGLVDPATESSLLAGALDAWAIRSSLDVREPGDAGHARLTDNLPFNPLHHGRKIP